MTDHVIFMFLYTRNKIFFTGLILILRVPHGKNSYVHEEEMQALDEGEDDAMFGFRRLEKVQTIPTHDEQTRPDDLVATKNIANAFGC